MILSKQYRRSPTAQAVTASARSTDYIDLGSARDIGVSCDHQQSLITVDEAGTAAGAATVTFHLQKRDDNTGFSSAKTVIQTDAIPKASLVVGHQLFLPISDWFG